MRQKRNLLLIITTFFLMFIIISCNHAESAVDDLKELIEDIEQNSDNYTKDEWDEKILLYSQMEEELLKYKYTDEELKEIGRLKGKYLGLLTKSNIDDLNEKINDFSKKVEGGIEGFLEIISNTK